MKFPGNMGELFEKVKQLQDNVSQVQDDLAKREIEASAGGGMVTVRVNGAQQLTGISIDKTVVNANDVDMLQDLVRAAVNEGMRKSRELMKEELSKLTGGLPIPGFS